MDTESPVIWPAWCYSGDTSGDTESPALPQLKSRKRPRMNGSAAAAAAITAAAAAEAASYHHNNNNSVKSERLSPGTPDTNSRSRSVTPSSAGYPGTPPASEHPHPPPPPPPLTGRNYSDFMRSLAAKYNNNNPNDYFGVGRNGFPGLDPSRFKANTSISSLLPSSKEDSSKKPEFPNLLHPFVGNPMFPPLIDMSSTQTLLQMVRTAKEVEIQTLLKHAGKRPQGDSSSPLDLSAAAPPLKRSRVKTPSSGKNSDSGSPRPQDNNDVANWSVDDVSNFVSSIDICAEYAQKFVEQRIDGAGLPLLTEEHLTARLGLKLGPALKLRAVLARRLGSCSVCLHCTHCHASDSSSPINTATTVVLPGTSGETSPS